MKFYENYFRGWIISILSQKSTLTVYAIYYDCCVVSFQWYITNTLSMMLANAAERGFVYWKI